MMLIYGFSQKRGSRERSGNAFHFHSIQTTQIDALVGISEWETICISFEWEALLVVSFFPFLNRLPPHFLGEMNNECCAFIRLLLRNAKKRNKREMHRKCRQRSHSRLDEMLQIRCGPSTTTTTTLVSCPSEGSSSRHLLRQL